MNARSEKSSRAGSLSEHCALSLGSYSCTGTCNTFGTHRYSTVPYGRGTYEWVVFVVTSLTFLGFKFQSLQRTYTVIVCIKKNLILQNHFHPHSKYDSYLLTRNIGVLRPLNMTIRFNVTACILHIVFAMALLVHLAAADGKVKLLRYCSSETEHHHSAELSQYLNGVWQFYRTHQ